jgi:predicted PurR-regulated permease PerM
LSATVESRYRFAAALAATVATVLLIWFFWKVADVLLLLFVASLVALYLGSVTDFIVERLPLPRALAFTLAVLGTLGAIVGLGALLVPPVVEQTRQLIGLLPDYIKAWQDFIARMTLRYPSLRNLRTGQADFVGAVVAQLQSSITAVVPTVVNIGHQIVSVVSIMVMGIYLALYPSLYREWLIAIFPPVHRDVVRDVVSDIATTLRSWIVAQCTAMFILGLLTAIGLYLLEVPYWLTFGVFVGVVVIIPFFGTLIGTLLPALFVLAGPGFHGLGPGMHFLLVLLLGVVVHIVEGNVVLPLITAKRVEIPPVIGMMSVLIVGRLLGIGGVVVAVPLAAVTMVIIRRILINRVYEGQSFRRAARDRALVVRVPAPDASVIVPEQGVDVLRHLPRTGGPTAA